MQPKNTVSVALGGTTLADTTNPEISSCGLGQWLTSLQYRQGKNKEALSKWGSLALKKNAGLPGYQSGDKVNAILCQLGVVVRLYTTQSAFCKVCRRGCHQPGRPPHSWMAHIRSCLRKSSISGQDNLPRELTKEHAVLTKRPILGPCAVCWIRY